MKSRSIQKRVAILAVVVAFGGAMMTARAQDIVGGTGRQDLSGNNSGGNSSSSSGGTSSRPSSVGVKKRPEVRYVTNTRTVVVTRRVIVTPTTGALAVATEPNAKVLVEPIATRQGVGQEGDVPANERIAFFSELKPGRYRVAAELDGYLPAEKETIISANKTTRMTLDLKPVTQTISLNANVRTGEVRYATVVAEPDNGRAGVVKYRVTGETRLVQLQNGRAILPDLRPGTYGVDVRAEEVGYQTLYGMVTVPGKTSIDVKLNRLLSVKTFLATWASDEWEMPRSWRVTANKLSVSGGGAGLPRDESYRHYTDFQLFSDALMKNGVAVSFVVRAVDDKNYYLIQITGAKADEPYRLRGFVVRNGEAQRFGAIPINHLAGTIKANQYFRVSIKAKGSSFEVSVADSRTGATFPLGVLTDPNRNFPIGAPGIAASEGEQNEFGSFIVCYPECPKQ